MRPLPTIALAVILSLPAIGSAQELDGFEPRTFTGTKGLTLPYRLFKVKNPVVGTKYPLILFLHGAGERGDNNTAQLMANMGAKVWATDANQAKHAAYVIAPQCPADKQWVDTPWANGSYMLDSVPISDQLTTALEIADEVAEEFSTDPARQYITGLSMGGFGTWDAIMRNPTRFAAAIPVCGGADPTKADLLKDLPIWTAHGDMDTVVPLKGTQDMVAALMGAGSDVEYSEYPGVGHDAWTPTYGNQAIIDWLFTHQRPIIPIGGAGGMVGMGGAAGSGGSSAGEEAGGAAGTGGSGGAGGAPAAGSSSAGSAGVASAGAPGSAGNVSMPMGMTEEDAGCSCRTVSGTGQPSGAWLALGGFIAAAVARKRRNGRTPCSTYLNRAQPQWGSRHSTHAVMQP
jgi:MYXO-CTERM domain-containing protein